MTKDTRDDGGPAFPGEYVLHQRWSVGNEVDIMGQSSGMTLRDHFAGQALAGLLASWSLTDDIRFARMSSRDRMKMFALNSYGMADAMLAERAKR